VIETALRTFSPAAARKWVAWAVALQGLLVTASAATYYVDFADGADGNNGLATTAPFQHCPGDANATAKAAVALAAGDTVIFKGGVTYLGAINCPSNGVTYDGNSAGTFGTGRAVFSGQNSTTQIYGITASGRSGLTFNNLEMELYGGHGSIPWTGTETHGYYGYAIYLDECSQSTVENCYLHDIGDWQNVANANEGYMEGVGIAVIDSGSAITITQNEFTRIGRSGIMIEPREGTQICTNISVTQNNFHDYIRWGVWLSTGNTNCTLNAITIDGNQFHDIYQYATGQWLGLPNDAPHVDCIIAYVGALPPQGGQTLGTAANPITIRNNFFYNNATVAQVQNSAIFLNTWGGRVQIYNNVFINTLYDGNGAIFCLEGTNTAINPAPDYWICNNSFYDTTYAVTLESQLYPLKNGSVRVLNNVFYKPDAGPGYSVRVMDTNSTPTQLDYNTYLTDRSDQQLAFTPGGYETFVQLQQLGYELHGQLADPQYANVSFGLGGASSSNDLHLQAGSPAIHAGLNLSSLFSTDKDGGARPAATAWDSGAYEYAGDAAAAATPADTAVSVSVSVPASVAVSVPASSSSVSTSTSASQPVVSSAGTTAALATAPAPSSRIVNLSARASCSTGTDALIAGFVVSGGAKQMLIRGVGPGLSTLGVTGVVDFPQLELYSGSTLVQSNDKWNGTAALEAAISQTGAFPLNPGSNDAAVLAPLTAGAYTAEVVSGDGDTGLAMVELYDDDASPSPAGRLINISARAQVGTGNNALVFGFVISGNAPETILIRGVGPSLGSLGVAGVLNDPQLDLYQNSTLIQHNGGGNNLAALASTFAACGAFPLSSPNDAVLVVTLQPGQYTAIMSGISGDSGIGLAEIYEIP